VVVFSLILKILMWLLGMRLMFLVLYVSSVWLMLRLNLILGVGGLLMDLIRLL